MLKDDNRQNATEDCEEVGWIGRSRRPTWYESNLGAYRRRKDDKKSGVLSSTENSKVGRKKGENIALDAVYIGEAEISSP
jgi:hypothetical protein